MFYFSNSPIFRFFLFERLPLRRGPFCRRTWRFSHFRSDAPALSPPALFQKSSVQPSARCFPAQSAGRFFPSNRLRRFINSPRRRFRAFSARLFFNRLSPCAVFLCTGRLCPLGRSAVFPGSDFCFSPACRRGSRALSAAPRLRSGRTGGFRRLRRARCFFQR